MSNATAKKEDAQIRISVSDSFIAYSKGYAEKKAASGKILTAGTSSKSSVGSSEITRK